MAVALVWPANTVAQQKPALAQQVALGEVIVQRNCVACHSVRRGRSSPHPQAPSFRYLSQSYPVAALAEALAEGIMTGHPDMPVFEFDAKAVDHIIAYLESIQDN
ncbi:MAG: cytochrome c [Rhizobiaceae bacterium]